MTNDLIFLFGDTKAVLFGIIEEVCQRLVNKEVESGHPKGCAHIRKWIKGYVGMKHDKNK